MDEQMNKRTEIGFQLIDLINLFTFCSNRSLFYILAQLEDDGYLSCPVSYLYLIMIEDVILFQPPN